MKNIDIKKIKKSIEKELDNKRYEHTLGVEYTAAALAMRYNESLKMQDLQGFYMTVPNV